MRVRDRERTSAPQRARPRPHAPGPPPAAETTDAGPGPTTAAQRLDGRRTHVVDRAADYVALADAGRTVAQIARRRRRSKGYVSILLRFGRLLAELPPDERAAMRSPRITWSLAQRLMRARVDPASARAQLRYALGGFSTASLGPSAAGDRPHDGTATRTPRRSPARAGVAWGWDADWFARDPAGYANAHLAHLTHLHRVVAARARQAAATPPDVGQSIRALGRLLSARPRTMLPAHAADPATAHAVAALEVLGHKLAEAAAAVATLFAELPASRPTEATRVELPAPVPPDEWDAAVEADLTD